MPVIAALKSWTTNELLKASDLNSNFSAIYTAQVTYGLYKDVATTISAVHTYSAAPVFAVGASVTTGGFTVTAGGLTVTAGGLTVSGGGASITGAVSASTTLTAGTGLTVSAGGALITGNVTITGSLNVGTGVVAVTVNTSGAATFAGLISGNGGASIVGTVVATTFSGSGASLTSLPAANLTGTIAAISGANVTSLNGSNVSSGTVAIARLPTAPTFTGIVTGQQLVATTATTGAAVSVTGYTAGAFALSLGAGFSTAAGTASTTSFASSFPNAATAGAWSWVTVSLNGVNHYIPCVAYS